MQLATCLSLNHWSQGDGLCELTWVMSLGWGVGDSSVAEAHRTRLGEVQCPKIKLRCCYQNQGNEWMLGRQKCLASLPLTHYKAVGNPSCPPPTPPVMSTHLQIPPDRENLVHPCFPLDDEPQALQARLTSQDTEPGTQQMPSW